MTSTVATVSDLRDRVDSQRIAMVSTVDERGTISSRPITIQQFDDSGDLWFLVDRNADWVAPAESSAVGATIIDDGETWLSFSGRAALADDKATLDAFTGPMSDAFFGDDSDPVVLRIATDRVEWWSAPGKLTQAFELAKAKLTDSQPNMGDSGSIDV